jgi:hypothetical protein
MSNSKAIVLFLSVLRHLKFQKPTCTSQQGRKTNKNIQNSKIHADILELFDNQNVIYLTMVKD